MEKYRRCQFCREVPEQNVYQCSSGHMPICHLCIEKVLGNLCSDSQCKTRFGPTKIRSQICEDYLDSQEFECKFQERGCSRILKRGDITRHGNSCFYNPDTVPLCLQLGLDNCNFRLGCVSREKIISHFQLVHKCSFFQSPSMTFLLDWNWIMSVSNIKMKAKTNTNFTFFGCLASQGASETSPVFMLHGKLKKSEGFMSFHCFKVWESGSHSSVNYNAIFSFVRKDSSPSVNEYDPFPFCGSIRVGGLMDALNILKASTVNFPLPLLIENETIIDHLDVQITGMTLADLGTLSFQFQGPIQIPDTISH